ncbi:MAG: UPF0182 family protein [Synechococcaceae cyanobacterium SM2_3_1]|nr:UPF0182 family protein [Synechococcaceae cyanobacterium SM2_3_1]
MGNNLGWGWQLFYLLVGVGAAVLLFDGGANFYVESAWFQSLGYLKPLWTTVTARWLVGLLGFGIAYAVLRDHLRHAWRQPPRLLFHVLLILMSTGFGILLMRHWFSFLCFLQQVQVGQSDPIFHRDLSFFLFTLPLLEALHTWLWTLVGLILCVVATMYLTELGLAKQRLTLALTRTAQKHLLTLTGVMFLITALGHWLNRYQILYSQRGSIYGASYTGVYAQLPAETVLVGIAILTGLGFLLLRGRRQMPLRLRPKLGTYPWIWSLLAPLVLLGGYWSLRLLLGQVYPELVQALIVTPNELERERPFIEYNIALTRQGFDLTDVEVLPFTDQGRLTQADIAESSTTVRNIRLWDTEPLLTSYRQLQEIRPYYQFPHVDVDRYQIGNELRQVMHSARELDIEQVPEGAKTWVNQRFFYTHGYGLTLSPVNVITPAGLPAFFIANIPPKATNPKVEEALPITQPAVYYGEISHTDVLVGAKARELDYPQEDQYIFSNYQGEGGVSVAQLWQRILFAWHFRDPRILISRQLTSNSRFLIHRQITERVQRLMPFLRYDSDPYLVIAQGRLFWILDAYTTSDRFPSSEPAQAPHPLNYIRNAVKVVIDAYHGSVDFYVSESEDPIIRTYQRIFPELFQSLDAMPPYLRPQIRFPGDLFRIQAEQFASYHMTDPQIFYNREDQWQISTQVRNGKTQQMQPQYVILQLPNSGDDQAEFVLLALFTPINKQNMVAWMAARCDGNNYGRILVYEFSRQRLILGPQQVEALINQDPEISEQISLWNEHGSRVNQGNLLVIPIKNALLYVQSLYLEAEESRLPQLTRVLAAYEDQVVMTPTLDQALAALFPPEDFPIPEEPTDRQAPIIPLEPDLQITPAAELVELTLEYWQQAQEALEAGNWEDYRQHQEQVGELLERLADLHSPSLTESDFSAGEDGLTRPRSPRPESRPEPDATGEISGDNPVDAD